MTHAHQHACEAQSDDLLGFRAHTPPPPPIPLHRSWGRSVPKMTGHPRRKVRRKAVPFSPARAGSPHRALPPKAVPQCQLHMLWMQQTHGTPVLASPTSIKVPIKERQPPSVPAASGCHSCQPQTFGPGALIKSPAPPVPMHPSGAECQGDNAPFNVLQCGFAGIRH